MAIIFFLFFSLMLCLSRAYEDCPILGPVFPPPSDFTSEHLQDAFSNLTEALDQALSTGNSTHGKVYNNTAFAIQFLSINDATPLFQYYYTPKSMSTNSYGVSKVDGDSIFRIGSVSKLLLVYTLLLEVGETYWDQPVTNFVPELQAHIAKSRTDLIDYTSWDQISLGALAGHLAGVTRDMAGAGGLTLAYAQKQLVALGFPPLNASEYPLCVANNSSACNRTEFFNAIDTRKPIYAPDTTPIYSNTAFQILAYALEGIVGQSFETLLQRSLVTPLNLTGTSYSKPNDSRGVIPQNPTTSWWNADVGDVTPAGGLYSTAHDLAAIGRSILASSLLSPNSTRAWMKPITHTSSIYESVGRPWEILRLVLPQPANRVTDMYTKAGNLGLYNDVLALLPDYGVGFITMAAGSGSPNPFNGLIADIVLPQFETIAREEADDVYAGTYAAAINGLNSSIQLTTDPSKPGLGIASFISNGTDMLSIIAELEGVSEIGIRAYPTNLESATSSGNGTSTSTTSGKKIAFRTVIGFPTNFQDHGVFASCGSWGGVDGMTYGRYAVDDIVITLNEAGTKAISVSPNILMVDLERKSA
ncbi:MAG: hypothetical protein M1834_000108 [Cirrosporium novae-zelandiae]|nr:MAG: hypothetical protein M1834_000108 [Cirrosporium novae-zelandiae]